MITSVTSSAPGKVLIVGGYLVLQEGINGYVVSTSSRFRSSARWDQCKSPSDVERAREELIVNICSRQFHDSWGYTLSTIAPLRLTALKTKADGSPKRNPYAEYAVETALLGACGVIGVDPVESLLRHASHSGWQLTIDLSADNEFYSQRQALQELGLPVTRSSLSSLPACNVCPVSPDTGVAIVHKTGLGSSAALVTSLTGAILALMGALPASPDTSRLTLAHDCAQVAHGLAQGKIGSGFDICSATFGSVAFSRIPPGVLGNLMDRTEKVLHGTDEPYGTEYSQLASLFAHLSGPVRGGDGEYEEAARAWKYTAQPFGLPPGLALALADVSGGSETPGMVRTILAWREGGPVRDESDLLIPSVQTAIEQASAALFPGGEPTGAQDGESPAAVYCRAVGPRLWKLLGAANASVSSSLSSLHACAGQDDGEGEAGARRRAYMEGLRVVARLGLEEAIAHAQTSAHESYFRALLSSLSSVKTSFATARSLLRALGVAAGVHVEPAEQRELADATLRVPGVIAAGVPGAGGYDALFAVLIDMPDTGDADYTLSPVRAAVEGLWAGWHTGALTTLLLKDGPAKGTQGAGIIIEVK